MQLMNRTRGPAWRLRITDLKIIALCQDITKSQYREIAQMEAILARQK